MVSSADCINFGPVIGYSGINPDDTFTLSIKIIPCAVNSSGKRVILIPIPGQVKQIYASNPIHNDYFTTAISNQSAVDVINITGADKIFAVPVKSFDTLSALVTNHIISLCTDKWGDVIIQREFVNFMSASKPGWSWIILLVNDREMIPRFPVTIVYRGPQIYDERNRRLLYFPASHNYRTYPIMGGYSDYNATIPRNHFILFSDDSSNFIVPKMSEMESIFSSRVVVHYNNNTSLNGDFYYSVQEGQVFIKRGHIAEPLQPGVEKYHPFGGRRSNY